MDVVEDTEMFDEGTKPRAAPEREIRAFVPSSAVAVEGENWGKEACPTGISLDVAF